MQDLGGSLVWRLWGLRLTVHGIYQPWRTPVRNRRFRQQNLLESGGVSGRIRERMSISAACSSTLNGRPWLASAVASAGYAAWLGAGRSVRSWVMMAGFPRRIGTLNSARGTRSQTGFYGGEKARQSRATIVNRRARRLEGDCRRRCLCVRPSVDVTGHINGEPDLFAASVVFAGVDGNLLVWANNVFFLTVTRPVRTQRHALERGLHWTQEGKSAAGLTAGGENPDVDGKIGRDFLGFLKVR